MDQDLIDYLERRFSSIDQRFDQVDQRFEQLETEVRRAYVVIEDLRGEVRLVAEGVTSVNQQLSHYQEEVSRKLREVESFNRSSYEDLDVRLRRLEATG